MISKVGKLINDLILSPVMQLTPLNLKVQRCSYYCINALNPYPS